MTTIKVEKGQVLISALKVYPGEGAVEFAMRFVEEMTLEHVQAVCVDLVAGNFEGIDDKRVRRCQFCGYYYEDKTKNNSSLVCSDECKAGKDVVLQAYRRKVNSDSKPKRPTYKDLHYAGHLEYPFWKSDIHMNEYDRKRGTYSYGDNLEEVVGKALLDAEMGGKKKKPQLIDYDGFAGAIPFAVNLSEKQHKTMAHKTIKRSAADIEADLLARYGEKKLVEERRRAKFVSKGVYGF
ncbi:hypothetical protein MPH47_12100 [Psychrobacillus psychrodurans]|uniref:hypothetical protein n=1 Tax=Psychrobacillus psychrodurans TaxID=126157 RepID=UPI001F4DAD95|nr:hypothetical protein [Psychrobacillus psychrodurans]MCK1997957.1 hypothetical protein [Psychrobacillus psychrodurans]